MGSRLHKIGTIYSRLESLMRKGVIKEEDKPLWFDLYSHFPPKYEPTFGREAPKMKVREIFYEEDKARAIIHAKFTDKHELIDLTSSEKTNSQILIEKYQHCVAQGMSSDEALAEIQNNPIKIDEKFFQSLAEAKINTENAG